MKNSFLLLGFLLFLGSCKNADTAPKQEAVIAEPAKAEIKLSAFPHSTEFADATLKTMDYKGGKFTFTYSGTGYELGAQTPDAEQIMCANSDKGQHIHLIVDNTPYSAQYTPEFDYAVEDGDHYILAFLSRSYHESIKNGSAALVKKATVKGGSITKSVDSKEPMLFYSRPKGTYTGKKETDKVMLDFFLANTTLGENNKVKVEVNGQEVAMLDAWAPQILEGLPLGENTVKLTLVDGTGAAVATPLNPVERTFTLAADPADAVK